MVQVEVHLLDAHAVERGTAAVEDVVAPGVPRVHLGDDVELVAGVVGHDLAHGVAQQDLGRALAVHLGGVDQGEARPVAANERLELAVVDGGVLTQVPGALAQGGDHVPVWERDLRHVVGDDVFGHGPY